MRFPILRSRFYFDRRDVLGFVGTLLASAAFNGPSNAADLAGRVEEIKGEAFANAGDQYRPLEKSSALYVGDLVETGPSSRLTMLLGEDTTIRLGERAHLVIDQFLSTAGGEISLQSGPMLFDRPSGSRGRAVGVQAPTAMERRKSGARRRTHGLCFQRQCRGALAIGVKPKCNCRI